MKFKIITKTNNLGTRVLATAARNSLWAELLKIGESTYSISQYKLAVLDTLAWFTYGVPPLVDKNGLNDTITLESK